MCQQVLGCSKLESLHPVEAVALAVDAATAAALVVAATSTAAEVAYKR